MLYELKIAQNKLIEHNKRNPPASICETFTFAFT